jgi:hypothetical protein
MTLGHYDDALRYMREARDLAVRRGANWLIAASPVQLGILAVLRGRLDEARPLLDEALDRSLAGSGLTQQQAVAIVRDQPLAGTQTS